MCKMVGTKYKKCNYSAYPARVALFEWLPKNIKYEKVNADEEYAMSEMPIERNCPLTW